MPNRYVWPLLCGAALLVAACGPAPSADANDYVGVYVFTPAGAVPEDPHDDATFVILARRGKAFELRIEPRSGEVRTSRTTWYLDRTTSENVVINGFAHPIERTRSEVDLIVNDDLGEYYEKVR